ncbi:hypothetical protein CVU82_03625 [Candidatus Falkowbacteria bacterium HGW-Falkowbacteria-1]|jgi:hypothetical protein|uniref:Uncharacterized protein n=1 Tax=Candidatus Falkowbacteria bacterium HGW-Falkowbacteria-1 TaxID=2013768 RepID=A0A2N2E8T5_9BACT|nr:MAG: hypothetical protein CVU82_03625 [Candidatus Falkowbacteria bacterium HGW-Falkowbacteria-1]
MDINKKFLTYIRPYLIKLKEQIGDDFVVFGSAPLYLLGVVEFNGKINDLDISLKNKKDIPNKAKVVTFHKNKEQLFYKIVIDDLEVDMTSLWPGCEYFFNKIHSDPVVADNFKFANLDIVKEWKEEMVKNYDRKKDKDYLKKIDEFLNKIK